MQNLSQDGHSPRHLSLMDLAVHLICLTEWPLFRNGVPGLGLLCVPGSICSGQCVTVLFHPGVPAAPPPPFKCTSWAQRTGSVLSFLELTLSRDS